MAEQQQEKKKFITFKPGVRPELFKALIFMGIMIGVMMISTIPFGLNNGLACGFAVSYTHLDVYKRQRL